MKSRWTDSALLNMERRNRKKQAHIQRHFCTAYSPKMNSCLVVWSCRTMRGISGKWALGWHCTHTLWRGGGESARLSAFKFTQTL